MSVIECTSVIVLLRNFSFCVYVSLHEYSYVRVRECTTHRVRYFVCMRGCRLFYIHSMTFICSFLLSFCTTLFACMWCDTRGELQDPYKEFMIFEDVSVSKV